MLMATARAEPMIVAPHINGYILNNQEYKGIFDNPEVALRSHIEPYCYPSGCYSYDRTELASNYQYHLYGYWNFTRSTGEVLRNLRYSGSVPLLSCPSGYQPAESAPYYAMILREIHWSFYKQYVATLSDANQYSPPYFIACVRDSKIPDPSPARSPGETGSNRSPGGCSRESSAPETPLVGNPCNAATGNKYEHETDYASAGPSALSLQRYYNSASAPAGLFGKWRSNYDGRVITSPMGATDPDYYRFPDAHLNKYLMYEQPLLRSVALERPDGKSFWFTQWSGMIWTTDPDVPGTFTSTGSGWAYTLRDGTVETYDSLGRLQRITNRTGLSQNLSYDPNSGRLVSVTDAFGHALIFGYDLTTGQLATLTSPVGQTTRYTYIGTNLARVDYPNGTAKLYHYEDSRFGSHLTGISHVEGNGTTNRFSTYTRCYGQGSFHRTCWWYAEILFNLRLALPNYGDRRHRGQDGNDFLDRLGSKESHTQA